MLKTKVCIVGSGPAGAVASLYLSKFNIPHILIERKKFPRDKVCGDCFDGR
ncbi:FAD-dependent monooxygenase, partial [Acinetobacter baumannii]